MPYFTSFAKPFQKTNKAGQVAYQLPLLVPTAFGITEKTADDDDEHKIYNVLSLRPLLCEHISRATCFHTRPLTEHILLKY